MDIDTNPRSKSPTGPTTKTDAERLFGCLGRLEHTARGIRAMLTIIAVLLALILLVLVTSTPVPVSVRSFPGS